MKVCPFCIADIPIQALKCRHCGEWVEKTKKPSTTASEPTMFLETPTVLHTKPCPYCGGLNSKDAWKCVYCCKNFIISKPIAIAISLMIGFLSATVFFCIWMPSYVKSQYTENGFDTRDNTPHILIKNNDGGNRLQNQQPQP